jgi:hypothetical protein
MPTRRQTELREALRLFAPLIPHADAGPVLERAGQGGLRGLPPRTALWLSLVSHIRHLHTDYDALLGEGYPRDAARFFVVEATNDCLSRWGATRFVSSEEDDDMPDISPNGA